MNYVAYYRVSTDRQGQSGLGLEAQRAAVLGFLGREPDNFYVEIESGAENKRPELAKAIAQCKETGASLIVAKLDRLTRDVKMMLSIIDDGIAVRFVDLPQLDPSDPFGRFMVTNLSNFGELERRLISKRTKEALAAKKARGERLGSPDPSKGAMATMRKAHAMTQQAASVVEGMLEATLREVAEELERRAIPTPSGGSTWHPATVRRVRRRVQCLKG